MRRSLPVLCLPLAVGLLSVAPVHSAADDEVAKSLFEEKCSVCHQPDRALRKSKDRAGWEKTILRMKRYASGLISDEDAATIVEYLTQTRGPKE